MQYIEKKPLPDGSFDILYETDAGDRKWQRVKRNAGGKLEKVGDNRPVRGVFAESGHELARGAARMAAFGAGNKVMTGVGAQGLAVDALNFGMDYGNKAMAERGMYPDTPLKAAATPFVGVYHGLANIAKDMGIVEKEDPRLRQLMPHQKRAVMEAIRNGATDIDRLVAVARQQLPDRADRSIELVKSDEQDKRQFGGYEGDNIARLRQLISGTGRMDWADEMYDKFAPRGSLEHHGEIGRRAIGTAKTIGELLPLNYGIAGNVMKAMGKEATRGQKARYALAASALPAGTAGMVGTTIQDYSFGAPDKPRTAQEQVDNASMWALGGGIVGPMLGAGGNSLFKGTVNKVNTWRGKAVNNKGQEEVLDAMLDGAFSDKELRAAYNLLREKLPEGVKIPFSKSEEMGEIGVSWIKQLLREHPDFTDRVAEAFGSRKGDFIRIFNKFGGANADDVKRALGAKVEQSASGIEPNSVINAGKTALRNAKLRLSPMYSRWKTTTEASMPIQGHLGVREAILDRSGRSQLVSEKSAGPVRDMLRYYRSKINRNTTSADLADIRKEVRKKLREAQSSANPNVAENQLVGAYQQMNNFLTRVIRENVGQASAERLRRIDQIYKAKYSDPKAAFHSKFANQKIMRDNPQGGHFRKALISAEGKIDHDKYTVAKNAFGGDKAGAARLDNYIGQELRKLVQNTDNKNMGKRIFDVIDKNWDIMTGSKRIFDRVSAAVADDLSKAVRRSIRQGGEGNAQYLLANMSNKARAEKIKGMFNNVYGKENGDKILRYLANQNIVHAKNPYAYYRKNREGLLQIFERDQVDVLGALAKLYENSGRFNIERILGYEIAGADKVKSTVGAAAKFLKSEFGLTPQMLASNIKLWATRVQGSAYVGMAALMRFFNAQNTKKALEVLLSEVGHNPALAKAIKSQNWQAITRDDAAKMWARVFPTFVSRAKPQTEGESRRAKVEEIKATGKNDGDATEQAKRQTKAFLGFGKNVYTNDTDMARAMANAFGGTK